MGIWMVAVGWILFAGTHIGLSSEPIRSKLIGFKGEKPFQAIYSLIALATFAFLIAAFVMVQDEVSFLNAGAGSPWMEHLSSVLMFLAFSLLFCGFANPSPMGMVSATPKAYGIIRITRHPMNMAFALFGLAHLLTNRLASDWIFYLGFVLYGILGAMHQDRRKIREGGTAFRTFVESTSILPFMAIVGGKQSFKFGELSKKALVAAVIVTVLARILHPAIRSQLF